jgi:hypothetical protein
MLKVCGALREIRFPLKVAAELSGVIPATLRALVMRGAITPTQRGRLGRGYSSLFDVKAVLALLFAARYSGGKWLRQDFPRHNSMGWSEVREWLGLDGGDPWQEEQVAFDTSDVSDQSAFEHALKHQVFFQRLFRLSRVVRERLGLERAPASGRMSGTAKGAKGGSGRKG